VNPWLILVLAGYAAVEWVTASWLASVIGWDGVLLVVLALVIVGAAVMRRAGFAATRSLRPVRYEGSTVLPGATPDALSQAGRDVSDAGWLFVAGFLIALPGLVTSAVGLLLLVPPVRRLVRARAARSLRRRAEAAGVVFEARTTTMTVQGDVVREDVPPPPRGEIVPGEIVREEPEDDAR
jgi:UPF0716 protein FxsA